MQHAYAEVPRSPKGPLLVLEHSRVLADLFGRIGQAGSYVKDITEMISIAHNAFSVGFCFGTLKGQTTSRVL